ncbi:hypothetical protein [uncultured Abiotrophia sp.]|uniref:hypothetical protein n=1 Tax=uncultured Abiotrophia sp. TaxID=316094 RepID=UPI0028D206BB|nr:hypothetical protein [uncultured Abiotrophia sp.]
MVWYLLFIVLVVSGVLYKYYLPEVTPILRAFIVFLSMAFILGCTLYVVYMSIPGANNFLSDSNGNFNLTVISVFIAGLSFFAGLQERERVRQLDLKRDRYIELEESLYQFRDEWEVVVNGLRGMHEMVQVVKRWQSERYDLLSQNTKRDVDYIDPEIREEIDLGYDRILTILNIDSEWNEKRKVYNQILNEGLPLKLNERYRRVMNALRFMMVNNADVQVFNKARNQLNLIKDEYNEKLNDYMIAGHKEAIFYYEEKDIDEIVDNTYRSLDEYYNKLSGDITSVERELDKKIIEILFEFRKEIEK